MLIGADSGVRDHCTTSTGYLGGQSAPIDRWSTRIIGQSAAVRTRPGRFPPGRTTLWSLYCPDAAHRDPVGMMMHDTAGPMISIRGSLRFPVGLKLPDNARPSPFIDSLSNGLPG